MRTVPSVCPDIPGPGRRQAVPGTRQTGLAPEHPPLYHKCAGRAHLIQSGREFTWEIAPAPRQGPADAAG